MKDDLRQAVGTDSKGRVMATGRKVELSLGRKPRRSKKEGHDELIAKLAPVGTNAKLFLSSGEIVQGRLKGSDRFTITLSDIEADDMSTDDISPVIIFYKHSIDAFQLEVIGDKYENKE